MDVEAYLQSQGWVKGQPLQSGGIKHPLLVKHRKDTKGLGYNPLANEGWWERVFDGHIKSLDVTSGSKIEFSQDQEKLRKATSLLYTRFRSGGVLAGTIKDVNKKAKEPHQSPKDSSKKSKKDKKARKRSQPDAEKSEFESPESKPKKSKRSSKDSKTSKSNESKTSEKSKSKSKKDNSSKDKSKKDKSENKHKSK